MNKVSHRLDIMAFGPHPDDVELGIGGTLALHAKKGYHVGICDMTIGEMGTNGTPEIREQECTEAAQILGVALRENLYLPDGFIRVTEENLKKAIEVIRKYQPKTVLIINSEDDHPDHVNTSKLMTEACHLAGLYRYPAEGERYRPEKIYYFLASRPKNPDLVVDISDVHETKIKSILAHRSQLGLDKSDDLKDTRLTHPSFLDRIKARDRYMGGLARCEFGEGFLCDRVPRVKDFLKFGGD